MPPLNLPGTVDRTYKTTASTKTDDDRRMNSYRQAGVLCPCESFQCGVQARATSLTAIFGFVGLKAIVSRLSVNGSRAAVSDSVSVLNCASRSVSCC